MFKNELLIGGKNVFVRRKRILREGATDKEICCIFQRCRRLRGISVGSFSMLGKRALKRSICNRERRSVAVL